MVNRPPLPAALAGLKEKPAGLVAELGSYCLLHGKQPGLNCEACDEHFPELVAARASAQPVTVAAADVQAMIDAAVKQAVKEAMAFQSWKDSPEGKAAAAAAATAGQVTPDHGTPSTGVASGA